MTRSERDGAGNVLVLSEHESETGPALRSSSAEYQNDRVVRTIDARGNESRFRYDAAGRPVSELSVMSSDDGGGAASQGTYDEWGNRVVSMSGDSTAYNLLRNGTFESNPLLPGNGWDGPARGLSSAHWEASTQQYTGAGSLVLGNYDVAPFITSDSVELKPATTYSLSAWMGYWGEVHLLQYGANGALLEDSPVLYSAEGVSGATAAMRRVSASVTTTAGVVSGRVRIQRPQDGCLTVDNIRLELANAAGPDSIVENQSMERVASGLPQAWHRRPISLTTAIHEQSSDQRLAGRYGHVPSSGV